MYDIKSLSKKMDFKLKSLEPKLLHKAFVSTKHRCLNI